MNEQQKKQIAEMSVKFAKEHGLFDQIIANAESHICEMKSYRARFQDAFQAALHKKVERPQFHTEPQEVLSWAVMKAAHVGSNDRLDLAVNRAVEITTALRLHRAEQGE